jgi:uncharacterized membrane protein required for colicin V production
MGINFENLPFGWVDVVVLVLLAVGVTRGRKRGMSEELLDVLKWALVVVVAAYAYKPVGEMLAANSVFSRFFSFVAAYALTVLLFIGIFSYLRPRLGEKIVESDFFGRGEYYMGMAAGAFRYACIILVLFALFNARQYTPQEIKDENAFQESNFGDIRFPTLITLQKAVFEKSMTGFLSRTYLGPLLIQPTVPEEKGLGNHSIVRARERLVQDVLEKR